MDREDRRIAGLSFFEPEPGIIFRDDLRFGVKNS